MGSTRYALPTPKNGFLVALSVYSSLGRRTRIQRIHNPQHIASIADRLGDLFTLVPMLVQADNWTSYDLAAALLRGRLSVGTVGLA